ncbi:hypothetical protein [Maricaulis sp. CAU 1757]
MTMDDAFDARLRAAFADAARPLERDSEARAFSHAVAQRLAQPDHKRILILGGAAAAGAAVAGSQLIRLLGGLRLPGGENFWAETAQMAGPEAVIALAMAGTLGLVATLLPRRLA